jgi:uncharacterized protein (TIRG00374 family)
VKKIVLMLLKISFSAAIVGYLVYDAVQGKGRSNVFASLVDQPKDWPMLAGAWAACAAAVFLTFVRWWYLVRALDVPCRFGDAVRISFWGYLFNLAPLGIVGGDLVKAVMLGRENPAYRARVLATVLVDRVIGLYLLFLVATAAILATGFWQIAIPDIHWICRLTLFLTLASTLGLGIVLGPDLSDGRFTRLLGKIPRVGRSLESLVDAVRMYRHKPAALTISAVLTVGVHGFFAIGCYLIARGLPGNYLSLAQHFVVMPISAATGVLPLPLGPFEFVLEFLYTHVPVVGLPIETGQGLVVALVYRLITLLIAVLGVLYYLGNRRELTAAIHQVEQQQPAVTRERPSLQRTEFCKADLRAHWKHTVNAAGKDKVDKIVGN